MWFNRWMSDERGVTAMEYGLMVSLISVAMMLALIGLGPSLVSHFTTLETEFAKSTSGP